MELITNAVAKLSKADITEAIDAKLKEKGCTRTGSIDFKTKLQKDASGKITGAVFTGAVCDAEVKPKK